MSVEVSTDASRLDVERVHRWLAEDAYWSLGRTREVVERSIEHSLNFGAYDDSGEQVGYARVVTDGATFAWLCDVYVDPSSRGAGVGTALLDAVTGQLSPLGLSRTLLATADAHSLYQRYGFEPLAHPERFMALTRR
ncbi:MAG TPA: GNAT family N-acetyltransferase [Nocardioides sp.]|nr:GNAT family N-acetyltransferase [Nocardioides sp.]